MPNGAKPKTNKPTWTIKIVPAILVITFFVCIFVCAIDAFGILQVNNIDKFWEAFFMILVLYVGMIGGGNLSK